MKPGPTYIGTYVDDNYVLGTKEAINAIVKGVNEQGLTVTIDKTLEDYLSCNIIFDKDKRKAWIGQLHLIMKMGKKFGNLVNRIGAPFTPGTPTMQVIRPKDGDEAFTRALQAAMATFSYFIPGE